VSESLADPLNTSKDIWRMTTFAIKYNDPIYMLVLKQVAMWPCFSFHNFYKLSDVCNENTRPLNSSKMSTCIVSDIILDISCRSRPIYGVKDKSISDRPEPFGMHKSRGKAEMPTGTLTY